MEESRNFNVNFSFYGLAKLLIAGLGLYFVFLVRDVVVLLFAAVIFSSALNPIVSWFERKGWPRAASLSLVYGAFLTLSLVAVLLVVPIVGEQVGNLSGQVPRLSGYLEQILGSWHLGGGGAVVKSLDTLKNAIVGDGNLLARFSDTVAALFSFFVFLVLTFYLVMAERDFRSAITYFLPKKHHEFAESLLTRVQHKLGSWLRYQLIVMVAVGAAIFLALTAMGIPNALALALFAAVMEIVPYFGPLVGALPCMLVALAVSPAHFVGVGVAYFVIQQLQNNFLTPRLMGQNAGLSPLIIIIAVLIGARINGVIGTLLAVPVATVLSVVLSDFFAERQVAKLEGEKKE